MGILGRCILFHGVPAATGLSQSHSRLNTLLLRKGHTHVCLEWSKMEESQQTEGVLLHNVHTAWE